MCFDSTTTPPPTKKTAPKETSPGLRSDTTTTIMAEGSGFHFQVGDTLTLRNGFEVTIQTAEYLPAVRPGWRSVYRIKADDRASTWGLDGRYYCDQDSGSDIVKVTRVAGPAKTADMTTIILTEGSIFHFQVGDILTLRDGSNETVKHVYHRPKYGVGREHYEIQTTDQFSSWGLDGTYYMNGPGDLRDIVSVTRAAERQDTVQGAPGVPETSEGFKVGDRFLTQHGDVVTITRIDGRSVFGHCSAEAGLNSYGTGRDSASRSKDGWSFVTTSRPPMWKADGVEKPGTDGPIQLVSRAPAASFVAKVGDVYADSEGTKTEIIHLIDSEKFVVLRLSYHVDFTSRTYIYDAADHNHSLLIKKWTPWFEKKARDTVSITADNGGTVFRTRGGDLVHYIGDAEEIEVEAASDTRDSVVVYLTGPNAGEQNQVSLTGYANDDESTCPDDIIEVVSGY